MRKRIKVFDFTFLVCFWFADWNEVDVVTKSILNVAAFTTHQKKAFDDFYIINLRHVSLFVCDTYSFVTRMRTNAGSPFKVVHFWHGDDDDDCTTLRCGKLFYTHLVTDAI